MVVNCARKKLANFVFSFAIVLLVLLTVPLDAGSLQEAVEKGQDKAVAFLLQQHGEKSHSDLSELLLLSCRGTTEGHARVIELLLAHGADLHTQQVITDDTPLHIAASHGATESVRILLARGAQVDKRAVDKQTPLHGAAEGGHADVVRLLLDGGADVHAVDDAKEAALVKALLESGKVESLQLLLEHGAEVDKLTSKRETALCLLIEQISAKVNGVWERARLLLLWGDELSDAVRQGLQGTNDVVWRARVQQEYGKVACSGNEQHQFIRQIERNINTSYAFEALRLLRDRQIDAFRAYGKHLHLVENMPKELVVLVQNFALSKAQKELMIEQRG